MVHCNTGGPAGQRGPTRAVIRHVADWGVGEVVGYGKRGKVVRDMEKVATTVRHARVLCCDKQQHNSDPC